MASAKDLEGRLVVSTSPHLRGEESIPEIMWTVAAAPSGLNDRRIASESWSSSTNSVTSSSPASGPSPQRSETMPAIRDTVCSPEQSAAVCAWAGSRRSSALRRGWNRMPPNDSGRRTM